MKDPAKEYLLKWVEEGLRLPDVERIYDTMGNYFKDGSEYYKTEESIRNKAQFPLYLLIQALAWLRDPEKREALDMLLNKKRTEPVVDLRKWKNRKQYFEGGQGGSV